MTLCLSLELMLFAPSGSIFFNFEYKYSKPLFLKSLIIEFRISLSFDISISKPSNKAFI